MHAVKLRTQHGNKLGSIVASKKYFSQYEVLFYHINPVNIRFGDYSISYHNICILYMYN